MSPQAAVVSQVAAIIERHLNAQSGQSVQSMVVLDRNDALMFIGAAKALAEADQKAEPAVNAALNPEADPAKPIKDFLGIYVAKLLARHGAPDSATPDDWIAFDYTTRADPDPRQKLTIGQVRRFIFPTK